MDTQKKTTIYFVMFAVFFAVICRLYFLNSPPFDLYAHAFRQSQTLSTIEDFYLNGINIFYPKVNYGGYPGYFLLELPVFQALAALIWKLAGSSIAYIRLLNIGFGLATAYLTYKLSMRLFGRYVAVYTLIIFLFIPLNILYHRSILIEPMVVFFSVVATFITYIYFHDAKEIFHLKIFKNIVLFVSYLIVILVKSLYLLPALVFLFYLSLAKRRIPLAPIVSLVAGGLLFLLWNDHANNVNGGQYLLGQLGFYFLTKPVYYITIGWRVINNFLNPVGILLVVLLFLNWSSFEPKQRLDIKIIFTVIVLYLILFVDKNRPHNYYQLVLMPYFAILAGSGLYSLCRAIEERLSNKIAMGILISFIIATAYTIIAARLFVQDPNLLAFQSKLQGKFEANSYIYILAGTKPADTLGNIFGLQRDNVYTNAPGFLYAANRSRGRVTTRDSEEELQKIFQKEYPSFRGNLDYIILQDVKPDFFEPLAIKLKLTPLFQDNETLIYKVMR